MTISTHKAAHICGFTLVENYRITCSYFDDPDDPELKAPWNQLGQNGRFTSACIGNRSMGSDGVSLPLAGRRWSDMSSSRMVTTGSGAQTLWNVVPLSCAAHPSEKAQLERFGSLGIGATRDCAPFADAPKGQSVVSSALQTLRAGGGESHMTRYFLFAGLVVASATVWPSTEVLAQNTRATQTTRRPSIADTAPVIDTGAMNALKRMGTYLRTLTAFRIDADVTTEEVLRDGQKVQFENNVQLVASRPNKLRVELRSDRKERLFVYDGKDFTLFAPRQKFYSTIDAPPTINDLATMLEEKYDVDLPLVDLFRFGTSDDEITRKITAAKDLGPSTINDITTEHFAFRQEGFDWQVWIQKGQYPLPLKLVITTMTDDARPQHTAQYEWNLAPSFNDSAFSVKAPDDYKKIAMAEVASARTQKTGEPNK